MSDVKGDFAELGALIKQQLEQSAEEAQKGAKANWQIKSRSALATAKTMLEFQAAVRTGRLRDSYEIGEDDLVMWVQSNKLLSNLKDKEGYNHRGGSFVKGTDSYKHILEFLKGEMEGISIN